MRKNKNTINIEGKIYQFDLEQRETGESSKHPGTPYIRGTIDVATDDELTNIVTVNYTYVAQVSQIVHLLFLNRLLILQRQCRQMGQM